MMKFMRKTKTMTLATIALASLGIASTAMADGKKTQRQVLEAHTDVLSQIELSDGVEITFSAEYDSAERTGEPVLSITAVGPSDAYPYLDQFGEQAATSLEAFLAVAPVEAEVPQVILDAHDREAAFLARSNAVYELALEPVMSMATYSSATCDSFTAFLNSISPWVGEARSQDTDLHSLTRAGGGNIIASMCNYDNPDPTVIDLKNAQFCSVNAFGFLICESAITVPDGHRVDRVWLGTSTARVVRALPLSGFPGTLSFLGIGGWAIP
ncbi:MAG: hypothetical protein AAGC55_25685 [Myxococcota bacterium]